MFSRHEGDPGLSSRSRDIADAGEQVLEFYLSNGQRDEYLLEWTIPLSDALSAFDYAFTYQQPAPWISWHDDG
jgi:hypothetical protein